MLKGHKLIIDLVTPLPTKPNKSKTKYPSLPYLLSQETMQPLERSRDSCIYISSPGNVASQPSIFSCTLGSMLHWFPFWMV